jgi:hypothetical protein
VKKCSNFDDLFFADFVDLMSNKLGLDDEGTEPDWMVWNFTYSQVEPLGWPTLQFLCMYPGSGFLLCS